ncbi:hypothetical protein PRIPAC_88831 [Pristionchus pacificus]|uniref:Uncharacterized protein n=1 Tax=Pristionchus pacificus TaxID=54126 RepID=A0A2A6CVT1_PRIPA|nr:hypothetical protein PRIPAC_88831 [Pristionchus pacificus]|eukprot:PDM82153.1 hypothetical protein PRIPAC_36546 [Pristionchus pacificus]
MYSAVSCDTKGAHWATYTTTDSAGRMIMQCANSPAYFDRRSSRVSTEIGSEQVLQSHYYSCSGPAVFIECVNEDLDAEGFANEYFYVDMRIDDDEDGKSEWYLCSPPRDNLKAFRQTREGLMDYYGEAELFTATATEPYYQKLGNGRFTCDYNPDTRKFALKMEDGRWIPSKKMACGYKTEYPYACGDIFNVDPSVNSWVGMDNHQLELLPNTTYDLEKYSFTHLLVNQGCTVTINDQTSRTVVGERRYGLWEVYNHSKHLNCPNTTRPFKNITCSCEQFLPPVHQNAPSTYQISHDSRYITYRPPFSGEQTFDLSSNKFTIGQSFSVTAAGKGLSVLRGFNVYFNGAFMHFIYNSYIAVPHYDYISAIRVTSDPTAILECNSFFPKTCDRGESSYRYRFSQRTGDCDFVGDANTCAEIGTDHVVWFTVPSGPMNHSTSRLAVRKGCRASAFTLGGTAITPQAEPWLHDWFWTYDIPSSLAGSVCTENDDIGGIVCECGPSSNVRKGGYDLQIEDRFKIEEIDVGTSIVFSGMTDLWMMDTQFALGPSPDAKNALAVRLGDGQVQYGFTNDNGTIVNAQTLDPSYLREGDWLECRLQATAIGFDVRFNGRKAFSIANQLLLKDIKYLWVYGMKLEEFRLQKEKNIAEIEEMDALHFGDYYYINGILTGNKMEIVLMDSDEAVQFYPDQSERQKFFSLEIDLAAPPKITQTVKKSNGETKAVTSTNISLGKGYEFHIVISNKPHSLEDFINGEILPVIGVHPNIRRAEDTYFAVKVNGAVYKICTPGKNIRDQAKPYLLSVGEGIARDGDEGVLLGVEYSGGGVHTESLHVGSLERPSDATSRVVRHLKGRRVTVAEDRWYQKEREMILFTILIVVLLLLEGAEGAACNSSGAHWATYTTTDSAGRMFVRCANSNAFFDEFEVEKLTCIDGDWFGTSCAGSAYYIGTSLPSFLCYTPQGRSDVVAEGEDEWMTCSAIGDNLKEFRQTRYFEKYLTSIGYAVMFIGTSTEPYFEPFSYFHSSHGPAKFKCTYNTATKKFGLRMHDERWIPSNNISCGVLKCPVYHYFDVSTGHCEPFYPNDCAQFFNFDSSTVESELTLTVKPSKSARLENISASRHMTHLLVYQGCKATIDGGYMVIAGDRTFGLSDVIDPAKHLTCPESASRFQSIWCTCDSMTPPIQDGIVSAYQMSHECRFISHGPDDSKVEELFAMGPSSPMRNGQTFSLNAFGQGNLTDKILTLTYKNSETFQRVNVTKDLHFTVGDKFHIQIRTMITGWNVYFNGAFVHFAHNYEKHFDSIIGIKASHIKRDSSMKIIQYNSFLPKNCERGSRPIVDAYKFSERTGDCEYLGPSSACVVLMNHAMGSWPAGNGPLTEELKQELIISRLAVRKGCWATPYNGYGLLGTACTDKDNIAGVVCECAASANVRDPGNTGRRHFPLDTVTVGSNIVFAGKLLKTGPATVNILVNSESAISLRLSINSGYVHYGYAGEGSDSMADSDSVSNDLLGGDWFECRISTQSYVDLANSNSLSISDMEVQEFRQQKEYVENMQVMVFLLYGDYFYVNGAMTGQHMVIDLLDSDLYVVFTLTIDLDSGEVVQTLKGPSGGDLTVSSVIVPFSKDTEFHIVFANKPHSLEVYINGEIIHPIIGQHPNRWAEEIYYGVGVSGATVYEMSHGPHRWD